MVCECVCVALSVILHVKEDGQSDMLLAVVCMFFPDYYMFVMS